MAAKLSEGSLALNAVFIDCLSLHLRFKLSNPIKGTDGVQCTGSFYSLIHYSYYNWVVAERLQVYKTSYLCEKRDDAVAFRVKCSLYTCGILDSGSFPSRDFVCSKLEVEQLGIMHCEPFRSFSNLWIKILAREKMLPGERMSACSLFYVKKHPTQQQKLPLVRMNEQDYGHLFLVFIRWKEDVERERERETNTLCYICLHLCGLLNPSCRELMMFLEFP